MQKNQDLYSKAHLIIAAIRIFEHTSNNAPTIEDIAKILNFSNEQVNLVCIKLQKSQILDIVQSSYNSKIYILNHLKIEKLKQEIKVDQLDEELKKFKTNRENLSEKIMSMAKGKNKSKKDLFQELDKQLKNSL